MFRIGDSFEDFCDRHHVTTVEAAHKAWLIACDHWHIRNRDKFEPLVLTSDGNYTRKIVETRQRSFG